MFAALAIVFVRYVRWIATRSVTGWTPGAENLARHIKIARGKSSPRRFGGDPERHQHEIGGKEQRQCVPEPGRSEEVHAEADRLRPEQHAEPVAEYEGGVGGSEFPAGQSRSEMG